MQKTAEAIRVGMCYNPNKKDCKFGMALVASRDSKGSDTKQNPTPLNLETRNKFRV